MKAKLFDLHNKFLQDYDTPAASPTLNLPGPIPPLQLGSYQSQTKTTTFRLMDTDETGALVYREVEDSSMAGEKAE
jgi:hypothetical protein